MGNIYFKIILSLLLGLSTYLTNGQELVSLQKIWTEGYLTYKLRFDTNAIEHDGKIYYDLYRSNNEFSDIWNPLGKLMRETDGRIYLYRSAGDKIIYDFNLLEGDTFHLGDMYMDWDLVAEQIDSVTLLNGEIKKRITLQPINPDNPYEDNTVIWIEGIGNLAGILSYHNPWSTDNDNTSILCVYFSDNIIFDNPEVEGCWWMTSATNEAATEKVSIFPNPGDETISIKGLSKEFESVSIYNSLGNLVMEAKSDAIQINTLPSGYYYLVVHEKNSLPTTIGFVKK